MTSATPDEWKACPLFWMRSSGFPLRRLNSLRSARTVAAVERALDLQLSGIRTTAAGHAWQAAESVQAEELEAARLALRALLQEDRVQEALFLSSPRFYETMIHHFTAPIERRQSRSRQKEKTATKYLQRFFAKNDTVSFFGPLAWGTMDGEVNGTLCFQPGASGLVSHSLVSFEHWAVQEVAHAISRDEDVVAQLRPILSPSCRIEGRTLFYPIARSAEIDDRWLAVATRCDGTLSWDSMLRSLSADPAFAGGGPSVADVARELLDRRIIVRELTVPTVEHRPEVTLRARVAVLAEPARSRWLPVVDWLCKAAERFARAGFEERRLLLSELNERFTALTGLPASRREGQMYAARGVIYEDCARNVKQLSLGRAFLSRLEPMAAMLDISSWITTELPRRYEPIFRDVFHRLAAGRSAVDLALLMRETRWIWDEGQVEAELRREVAAAWATVLGHRMDPAAEQIRVYTSDCAAVHRLLLDKTAADGPEVLGADFHSVDLLIAGDPNDVRVGGGAIVVGELHKGVFLAAQPVALSFCPDPEALFQVVDEVISGPVLSLVDAPRSYQRSNVNWPDRRQFHEIVTDGAQSRFSTERSWPISSVEVIEEGNHLYVASRDGNLRAWLFSVLTGFVQQKLLMVDPLELTGAHTPRVVLEELIVRRRRWLITTGYLRSCPGAPDSAMRLGWARRLQRRLRLPERIFVVSPNEQKPIYVDFGSFMLVELLYKLAHEADTLIITEMLPAPDELWLEDEQGERYTAEFRVTLYRARRGAAGDLVQHAHQLAEPQNGAS